LSPVLCWWTLKFFYLGHLKNFYTIQYNTIILMSQFLMVVQQHILGVAVVVIYFCCKFNRRSSGERMLKIAEDFIKLLPQ